jgi:hypothetical protein
VRAEDGAQDAGANLVQQPETAKSRWRRIRGA